jgi:hypothetical protein
MGLLLFVAAPESLFSNAMVPSVIFAGFLLEVLFSAY